MSHTFVHYPENNMQYVHGKSFGTVETYPTCSYYDTCKYGSKYFTLKLGIQTTNYNLQEDVKITLRNKYSSSK